MMNSNISGNPINPNIVNFYREVDNNVQLNEFLRREIEQLKNAFSILIEHKNTQIQKMMEEQDQLKIELNMAREKERGARLFSEQLSTHNNQLLQLNNNLQNQHKDQLNAHQEDLKQLIESLRGRNEEIEKFRKQNEERNAVQLQNLNDSIEQKYYSIDRNVDSMQICMSRISGKFVFVSHWDFKDCLSSDNVEQINFVDVNDSLYKKELLVWTYWECMNTTCGNANFYANLLSLCKKWKRLRPDGEIHCLYCYYKSESPSEPDDELASLLTTYNKYLDTGRASDISAIRQYWPNFADLILSEKIKNEYPA